MKARLLQAGRAGRRAVIHVGHAARDTLPDALMLAGAGSVAYGAWLVYVPAGFIVGGLLLLAGGVLSARRGA